jgi:hypothetical protein
MYFLAYKSCVKVILGAENYRISTVQYIKAMPDNFTVVKIYAKLCSQTVAFT